jgi:RNA polymerase sigma-70 factor (ECF subfamily)
VKNHDGNIGDERENQSNLLSQDGLLWDALKKGDRNAYAAIYDKYFPALYRYGRKFTKNSAGVEDAIQSLFIDLWKYKNNLSVPPSIKNYLFKAFRSHLLKSLKHDKSIVTLGNDDDESYCFDVTLSHEQVLVDEQTRLEENDNLKLSIENLPPRQKEVIYLLFYEGQSHDDIASIMSLKKRTVYNLLHQAVATLKKHFKLSP